jgi:HEAT repeat protein
MVAKASHWDLTPRQSIEQACASRGPEAVIDGCVSLLEGNWNGVDDTLIVALGGPPARRILSGQSRADPQVWIRVWALRGLLWVWDDRAGVVLSSALADRSWRVREMAIKVARRHLVGEYLATIAALQDDPTERVRTVATDAVRRIAAERA